MLALLAFGCGHASPQVPAPVGAPDTLVLGRFEDDYGNRFVITPDSWRQLPRSEYHIVHWRSDLQYLIARNDARNSAAAGRWTRIDWMRFSGMPPYTWGFCLSAYQAPSAAAAESTLVARRETPRTGCNGFPFSRMKRIVPP